MWKKSRESHTWRSWTGITDLYKALSNQHYVEVCIVTLVCTLHCTDCGQVKSVEFLELHSVSRLEASWSREAVFQYLVLLSVQVAATRGKVSHRTNMTTLSSPLKAKLKRY